MKSAKTSVVALLSKVCGLLLSALIGVSSRAQDVNSAELTIPQLDLHDPRLSLTLFAEHPTIVTPIGMAIDAQDRIYVIESHTHHPPADYAGPKADRILVFEDRDRDGNAEQRRIFAEGLQQAMNLAFSPAGDLYVVCAREVLRLSDRDGDGKAEVHNRVLSLDTTERYAHNSLLGVTFDPAGHMYVSRGNTGSRYHALRGSDGSIVEGYGDGGSVARANADGSHVELWASGFWNPFDLEFTSDGELLLVDNDPDARGPNRLLKVAQGGDYGYRSLYGGGGNHPFQGWDGQLPGTLPYICGTGEAPSGLIDLRQSSFPADYSGSILVTIWNENSIERFELLRTDGGLKARKSRFLTGDKDFRPVALACDSEGNLYFTDWVRVDYPNHGFGRIWRVSFPADQHSDPAIKPMSYFKRTRTAADSSTGRQVTLRDQLISEDAFERHHAIGLLMTDEHRSLREELAHSDDAQLRLAALLASIRGDSISIDEFRTYFADPDERVRIAALVAAGNSFDPRLRAEIDLALDQSPVTPRLFECWLAAAENLQPEFSKAVKTRSKEKSNQIRPTSESQALWKLASDSRFADEVRGLAIERIDASVLQQHVDQLLQFATTSGETFSFTIMRRLAREPWISDNESLRGVCQQILDDSSRSELWRTEAVTCLASLSPFPRDELVALLGGDEALALAAADGLVERIEEAGVREAIQAVLQDDLPAVVWETLCYAVYRNAPQNPFADKRPSSVAEWAEELSEGGNPDRGRRIFGSRRAGCAQCHRVDGIGSTLGPDLGQVTQSKSRRQVTEAILEPSAEFAPQYQAWLVVTDSGKVHRGLQLDHKAAGAIEMIDESGEKLRFSADEIVDYRASPQSLMPDGLEQSLSLNEFRDLVAFLCALE